MVDTRYNRQSLIDGWEQSKLYNSKVTLIGSGPLSDFILVDLLSLGIGNIMRIGYTDSFEFERINSTVYLEQKDEELSSMQHAEISIENSDVIIDATNNLQSKFFSSRVAKNKGKGFISACSDSSSLSLCIDKSDEELLRFHEKHHGNNQGKVYSMICSGFVADELRKKILPIKDDVAIESYSFRDSTEKNIEKKIIQIGAGAIGTFSGIALAMLNADLTIVDYDVIEETNLNRQFLFYDSVGLNKSEVLAERLRKYSPKIKSLNEKVNKNFDPTGFDYIFICVDNNKARFHINEASRRTGIPLINGGSSLFAGNAMPYIPGKTACLNCQTNFKLEESLREEEKKRRAPGECFHPSLIVSNQIVGGFMINCFIKSLNERYEKSNYVSGQGIYNQKVNTGCFGSCK
jgi:molybdopterin/thiamine biosynthesis adenylyltransferase